MKIALINLEEDYGCLPMGLANLAAYVRKYGGYTNIKIVDREDLARAIKNYNPDIIGIGVVSEKYYKGNQVAGKLKGITKAPIIIGGAHITAMPEQLSNSNFDLGVMGEGEITFLELLNLYKKGKKFNSKNLKNIKGIVFRNEKGGLQITPRRELIKNLDDIPFPALDLLKMKEYYLVPGLAGANLIGIRGYLMTSRGCPYNCVYCGSNTAWGGGVRWHSAERVVDDIKRLVNVYGVNHINVNDDLMIINRERLKKIIESLEKEDILKNIDFELFGRANIIDEEMCILLKKMNVTSITFGLESGSEKILKYLKKGTVTVEQGKKAVTMCHKHGLNVGGFFMVGNPGETEKDLEKTMELVKNPNLSSVQIYQTTPLPGTELWDKAIKDKIISPDLYEHENRGKILGSYPDVLLTKEISREKFVKWLKLFRDEMQKKNDVKYKFNFSMKRLKYFFSPRLAIKLWHRRKYIPRYIKQVLRI